MYTGPTPQSINANYPPHTYDLITCLVNGEQKRIIQDRYLQKFGYTKQTYLAKFPLAPLKSMAASESYRRVSTSQQGRKQRSDTMRNLNLNNKEFQSTRQKSCKEYWDSIHSNEVKKAAAERARIQHKATNLDDCIRNYFKTKYIGSLDQENRSIRATNYNPRSRPGIKEKIKETYIKNSELGLHNKETKFKKKKFENTDLIYQSTYELDFLEFCKTHNLLHRIKNAFCLSADYYPYNFYAPDYILDDTYVIEIKSGYIENLQEKRYPGILKLKEQLVINKGYKFLYIKDKDYRQLDIFFN